MKPATIEQRVGLVVLLTISAIAFHESGHFIVYRIGGCPVRITLQSVRPIGNVRASLNNLALVAGPAFSFIAAIACLVVARRCPSFFWVTAAFTNASLRLFALLMDKLRVFEQAAPFSDEGNLAIAITTTPAARVVLLLSVFAVLLSLTVAVARLYNLVKHPAGKVVGIYFLSLATGIAIVLIDELLH